MGEDPAASVGGAPRGHVPRLFLQLLQVQPTARVRRRQQLDDVRVVMRAERPVDGARVVPEAPDTASAVRDRVAARIRPMRCTLLTMMSDEMSRWEWEQGPREFKVAL